MSGATIELTVCLIADFHRNDINERRLSGATCESANYLHKVGEARWTPAENSFGLFDAMNQVFNLMEHEFKVREQEQQEFPTWS